MSTPRTMRYNDGTETKDYVGFNHDFHIDGTPTEYVLMVLVDGELDCIALDHPKYADAAFAFLAEDMPHIIKLGVYRRQPE